MFFFRHPKPVVDPRPVAEQSVQVKVAVLPALTELVEPQPGDQPGEGMAASTPPQPKPNRPG